jgi:hypothetical protein
MNPQKLDSPVLFEQTKPSMDSQAFLRYPEDKDRLETRDKNPIYGYSPLRLRKNSRDGILIWTIMRIFSFYKKSWTNSLDRDFGG